MYITILIILISGQSVQSLLACYKVHRRILHTMQTFHQTATQGRNPKGGNQKRQHKHGNAAYCLPGQQAEDFQQGQAHASYNVHSARHTGQERKRRHNEDQSQNKQDAIILRSSTRFIPPIKVDIFLYMYIITLREGANKDASVIPTSGQSVQKRSPVTSPSPFFCPAVPVRTTVSLSTRSAAP